MPLTPRAVVQCTREGEDIKAFPTVIDACKELGIKNKEHIYKSIRHGVVAFGYRWRYLDEPLVEPQAYDMRLKAVVAVKDSVDQEFPSIVEASKATGATVSHIQQAILTGGKAKGYCFRLKGSGPKEAKGRHCRAVVAVDDSGSTIREWPSVYATAESLGVIPAAIYQAINSRRPDAKCKGYRLRYKGDV